MIRHANHAAKSRNLLFRGVTRGEIDGRERAAPDPTLAKTGQGWGTLRDLVSFSTREGGKGSIRRFDFC
jgi:hypothetical protein